MVGARWEAQLLQLLAETGERIAIAAQHRRQRRNAAHVRAFILGGRLDALRRLGHLKSLVGRILGAFHAAESRGPRLWVQ